MKLTDHQWKVIKSRSILDGICGFYVLARVGKICRSSYPRIKLDLTETYIDGSFSSAKKRPKFGKTKRGKGTKIMAIADCSGLPVAVGIENAFIFGFTGRGSRSIA